MKLINTEILPGETLFELGLENIKMREHIYSLLDLPRAEVILDIGCGYGHDLLQIGKRAAAHAKLFGIDQSEKAIKEAEQLVAGDPRYSFSVVDVASGLPFGSETVDIAFSINVLECIPSKDTFLTEVYRVLRPDGQVVFAHFDWDSQLINGRNKTLIRKLTQAYNDWKQPWMAECDAWMGRRLQPLFNKSGLFEGEIYTYTLTNTEYSPGYYGYERIKEMGLMVKHGIIQRVEYESFCNDIAEVFKNGEYFFSITMFIGVGRKRR